MTVITMGTQDESPMIIESAHGQIVVPYDDAANMIGEIARYMHETPLEVVQHFVSGHGLYIDDDIFDNLHLLD